MKKLIALAALIVSAQASAFWGWNDVWLHSDFKSWTIEAFMAEEMEKIREQVQNIE